MDWSNTMFLNNTALQWLTGLGIALGILLLVKIIQSVLARRLAKIAAGSATTIDDTILAVIKRTKGFLVLVVALAIGARALALPEKAETLLPMITVVALALQIAIWLNGLIDEIMGRMREVKKAEDPSGTTAFGALSFVLRLVVWSIIGFLVLDNMGVNITAIVAGLGIGGIAVALAVQNILGDLFNSVAILIDKPFEVGDFIIVGDLMGSVEKIGIRTTRVRSLTGEELIFSNSDLVNSRIKNYKTMRKRRVVFEIGVVYQTPPDKLESIPTHIENTISGIEDTEFDRSHFKQFGDSALVFETVYYVLSGDYNHHVKIQQEINIGICRKFTNEAIEFAYPTRTIFMESH